MGYKNERYLNFGRSAARLDDGANFLPSRLSALLLIPAAGLTKQSMAGALRIWRRDRRRHESPNSAQTESAMAGALGVQLGGPAFYFGELHDKPAIGDPLREIEYDDIKRAVRMLYAGSGLCLAFLCGIRVLWEVL